MTNSESVSPNTQAQPAPNPGSRSEMLDIAKGIAIILVVYGHVMQGMDHRGLVSKSFHGFSNTLVYSFHMPLFFFIAGLFSRIDSKTTSIELLKRRGAQLLWPYVLWMCIYQGLNPIIGRWTSNGEKPFHLVAFLWDMVAGQGIWFLYALFLVHVIAILTRRLSPVLVLAGAVIAYCSIDILLPNNPDFIFGALIQRLALNLPFFVIGSGWSKEIMAGLERHFSENSASRTKNLALLMAPLFGLLSLLAWLKPSWGPYEWSPVVAFAASLNGILLLLILSKLLESSHLGSVLNLVGAASLAVFLLHPFGQGLTRVVWARIFGTGSVVTSVIAQTLVSVALATLAYFLAERAKATWLFRYPLAAGPRKSAPKPN